MHALITATTPDQLWPWVWFIAGTLGIILVLALLVSAVIHGIRHPQTPLQRAEAARVRAEARAISRGQTVEHKTLGDASVSMVHGKPRGGVR